MLSARVKIFWQVFSRAGKQGLLWLNSGCSALCNRGRIEPANADSEAEDEIDMPAPLEGWTLYRRMADES
jgi:hypothetical protein